MAASVIAVIMLLGEVLVAIFRDGRKELLKRNDALRTELVSQAEQKSRSDDAGAFLLANLFADVDNGCSLSDLNPKSFLYCKDGKVYGGNGKIAFRAHLNGEIKTDFVRRGCCLSLIVDDLFEKWEGLIEYDARMQGLCKSIADVRGDELCRALRMLQKKRDEGQGVGNLWVGVSGHEGSCLIPYRRALAIYTAMSVFDAYSIYLYSKTEDEREQFYAVEDDSVLKRKWSVVFSDAVPYGECAFGTCVAQITSYDGVKLLSGVSCLNWEDVRLRLGSN
jgi:hypothetical protein